MLQLGSGYASASGLGKTDSAAPFDSTGHAASAGRNPSGAIRMEAQWPASLRIEGAISHTDETDHVVINMATLETLKVHTISTTTVVTDGVLEFEGVLMRTLLDHIGAYGKTVTARAVNGYEVDIPVQDFFDFDVLLAWAANGERLKSSDKGPFWIVYPRDQHDVLQDIRYDYRWVWQLNALRVN